MTTLDIYEQTILNINKDSNIEMVVHGDRYIYKPVKEIDGSWDLEIINIDKKDIKITYGLSCENLHELRALLLADYATGIITEATLISPENKKELGNCPKENDLIDLE